MHQQLVQLWRFHPSGHFTLDGGDLIEQLPQILARLRRREQYRRPIEKEQFLPQGFQVLLAKALPLLLPSLHDGARGR